MDGRLGVFLVQTYSATDPRNSNIGTCFLLNTGQGGPAYLMTNFHAIENVHPVAKIVVPKKAGNGEFTARILGKDEKGDLALLVSYDLPKANYIPVTLARQSPPVGARIEIVGFPESYYWPGRGTDQKERAWYPVTYSNRDLSGNLQCTAGGPIFHGNSGSPGFYKKEVAVVIWGAKASGGGVGTPVESVWAFLRNAGLSLPRHPALSAAFVGI